MIKLSIFYPNTEGKNFDKDYYINKHMPLSIKLQGEAIKNVQVDFGISGLPGTKATYIAICHFIYDSYDAFDAAFMPHAEILMKDIANYTDIETIVQFSEVKLNLNEL